MHRMILPAGSKCFGCNQDRFSAHISFVNVGKNWKTSKNGVSCSTTRWIVIPPSVNPRVIVDTPLLPMLPFPARADPHVNTVLQQTAHLADVTKIAYKSSTHMNTTILAWNFWDTASA